MVEKFDDKDAKNGNFNNQMGFRKKSNLFGTVRIVKAWGSNPFFTSDHCKGVDTRASLPARTE